MTRNLLESIHNNDFFRTFWKQETYSNMQTTVSSLIDIYSIL